MSEGMTILQMLQRRCDFQKNDCRMDENDDLIEKLPKDVMEFYREADGGWGRIFPEDDEEKPDFILYSREQMQEKKRWFLEYSAMLHAYMCQLVHERSVSAEETEKLAQIGTELELLGQCGDPEWPDYLFLYRDTFFLVETGSLDFPFRDWAPEEEECAAKGSYMDFLSDVLRSYEIAEMERPSLRCEEDLRQKTSADTEH